ncbi:MAG: hypothetical protein IID43_00185 [Planctomycetes bacterium]|nr:hypothetical protein [Planctomycetota bacterium]
MNLIKRQKIWLALIITANLLLWIIPSDVVELIARDRHTLLGRYSKEHFYANVGLGIFSLVSFYVDWSTGQKYKRRWFQVLATLLFLTPTLLLLDFVVRSPEAVHYVRDGLAYHRPANFKTTVRFVDRPEAARTYPNAPDGYPPLDCTLQTDTRGYRNQTALESYDVVVLGDSFAEGSKVSNGQTWPERLAALGGLTVYNLGMSGYAPINYLASLKRHGPSLNPRVVICCLYEGNDFRSAKTDRKGSRPSLSKRMKAYFKQSRLLGGLDEWAVATFGPINRNGHVPNVEMLDWLPLAIPDGPGAKHYAFAPKQLRDMFESREAFALDKHWLNPRQQLEEMHRWCNEAGSQFIVLYAPTKAHVTLPMVAQRLPAEDVRSFLALRFKKTLPSPSELLVTLVERAGARESVVAEWCAREEIPLISTTEPLRQAAADGTQVYFTYDQHWTPPGHKVVAQTVHAYLVDQTLQDD